MSSCSKSIYAFTPLNQCWTISAFIPPKYDFKLNTQAFSKINACYSDIPICFSSPVYYLPSQASILVEDLVNSKFNAVLSGNYIVIDDSSFDFSTSLYSQYFTAFNVTPSSYQVQYVRKYQSPLDEIVYINSTTNEQFLNTQSNWTSANCLNENADYLTLYSLVTGVSSLAKTNQSDIFNLTIVVAQVYNALSACCDYNAACATNLFTLFSSVSSLSKTNQTNILSLSSNLTLINTNVSNLSSSLTLVNANILSLSACCTSNAASARNLFASFSAVSALGQAGLNYSLGGVYGTIAAGLPLSACLWLKTDKGTEYNATSGIWIPSVGPSATQATSGKRPSAITTVSSLNGRNAVPFGSSKNLSFSPAPTWRTLLFVATRTTANGNGLFGDYGLGGLYTMGYAPNPGLWCCAPDRTSSDMPGVGGPRWSIGGNTLDPTADQWLNRPHVYGFQWKVNTLDAQVSALGNKRTVFTTWVDGNCWPVNLNTLNSTQINVNLPLSSIGSAGYLSDASYYWDGSVSEVIAWDRELSYRDVQSASNFLLQKYNIAKPHPNPKIMGVGDSITAGSNGPSWLRSVSAKKYYVDHTYDWIGLYMEAVGGRSTTQVIANIDQYTPMVVPGQIVSVFIGTNDLDNGLSVDEILYNIRYICNRYTDAGGRVVVCSMIPRTGTTSNWTEAERVDFNNRLRATWKEFATALVDFAADSRFAAWSSTYYVDGAHPNQAGADALAEVFVASVVF